MRPNSPRFSRVKSGLILSSVDKWLTKICMKKTVSAENQSLAVNMGAQNRTTKTKFCCRPMLLYYA